MRAGFADTAEWAARVGRSTRVVLGLERGEPAGRSTLALVEGALGWAPGHAWSLLNGEANLATTNSAPDPEVDATSVGADAQDAEEILFRLPPGLTPRQRETARRLGRQSIETYLDSLKE